MKTSNLELEQHIPLPKKPRKQKPTKHTWKKKHYDVGIDIFGWEGGDYHNGPTCVKCGFGGCHHCEPGIYEDTTCLDEQALDKYYDDLGEVKQKNHDIDVRNELRQALTDSNKEDKT